VIPHTHGSGERASCSTWARCGITCVCVGIQIDHGEVWSGPIEKWRSRAIRTLHRSTTCDPSGAAEVALGASEQRSLSRPDFHPVPSDSLAQKSGQLTLHPNELSLGYGVGAGTLYDFWSNNSRCAMRVHYFRHRDSLAQTVARSQQPSAENIKLMWALGVRASNIWLTRAARSRCALVSDPVLRTFANDATYGRRAR